ncbi:MAG: hypothetical protein Q8M29_12970 [Bacteroidota bacterium]|nr:hypothetical protein [Bacteroidota bacterium]
MDSKGDSLKRKLTDNGMQLKADSLSLIEYKELRGDYSILPELPPAADSIEINYYHDDFLGDYSIDILFTLPKSMPLPPDTLFSVCKFRYKNLKQIKIDTTLNYKWCNYSDGRM